MGLATGGVAPGLRSARMQSRTRSVITVVDDDAGVRDSLRFLLEGEGYAVETYASGGDFLARAVPSRIACLLVDQRMPSGAGLELIEQLRGRGISTPWLLLAGTPEPAVARRAAE